MSREKKLRLEVEGDGEEQQEEEGEEEEEGGEREDVGPLPAESKPSRKRRGAHNKVYEVNE